MAVDGQVESFLLFIIFVSWDSFVAVNPPLTQSPKPLAAIRLPKSAKTEQNSIIKKNETFI